MIKPIQEKQPTVVHDDIAEALAHVFMGISKLKTCCVNGRQFTIDGRLVGDIGELIAARDFDLTLDTVSSPIHDGQIPNGRKVQVKATFKEQLTISKEPELYLGLKLYEDGGYEVIFNGPGSIIMTEYAHRKGIGDKLLSFPIKRLRELSQGVDDSDRVQSRTR